MKNKISDIEIRHLDVHKRTIDPDWIEDLIWIEDLKRRENAVAVVSFVYDQLFYISNIAIIKLPLGYGVRYVGASKDDPITRPISREGHNMIEAVILEEFNKLYPNGESDKEKVVNVH